MSRPDSFRPEYCDELIRWMAQGKSYITWGAKHSPRVAQTTMYEWEKKFPDWVEAKKTGYALGLDYYENLLQAVALGIVPNELKELGSKRIDITAVIFVLKTRFHREYGEMQKIDHTSNGKDLLSVEFVDMPKDK
jgi:hypothetical protein